MRLLTTEAVLANAPTAVVRTTGAGAFRHGQLVVWLLLGRSEELCEVSLLSDFDGTASLIEW